MNKRPNLGASGLREVAGKRPQDSSISEPRRWSFSFQYWKQISFFGLDKSKTAWFASFLERLKDLSGEAIEAMVTNRMVKGRMHYHAIDWDGTNVPLDRSDLNWLPAYYLDNPKEFPIVQFMVSKGLGRIVGFWDERQVFNIVLLDPLHNIQPSKDFNYRVDPCEPLPCQYTALLKEVEGVKTQDARGRIAWYTLR